MKSPLQQLADIILDIHAALSFTILEVGAAPVEGVAEPFYQLAELFEGTQIHAFEPDPSLCMRLNLGAKPGVYYHSAALGVTEESRTFYETSSPLCCSLYKPNVDLISYYNNMMELAAIKSVTTIDTISLDHFLNINNIKHVDFIKIDIQGAELDVFQGGEEALKDVIGIVSEVEFIPHYIGQPLFGDVCSFLSEHDLMFHKFLGLQGRALKPVILQDNPNFPSQHIWSDAVFIRDITKLTELSSSQLLKLGIISLIYGSPDVTFHCLKLYDGRNMTTLHKMFIQMQ